MGLAAATGREIVTVDIDFHGSSIVNGVVRVHRARGRGREPPAGGNFKQRTLSFEAQAADVWTSTCREPRSP